MQNFDDIRFYNNQEVKDALHHYVKHPMVKALLQFTFPDKDYKQIKSIVAECESIRDFQSKVIYHSVENVLDKSSEGLTDEGFNKLEEGESYFYISNHRDIVLDTCLINYTLYDHDLVMTASAIGDNLVQKPFLMALSKLNRNFLVLRNQSPREMLKSSLKLSEYLKMLMFDESRSVWMAQRQGRTKDGNDVTQQGVLKMIGMAKGDLDILDYFAKLKIVPVAISYEFDPTDMLKMPEVLAKRMKEEYKKSANEDFNSIMKGAMGQKGRIQINAGEVLTEEDFSNIRSKNLSINDQLQEVAALIDRAVYKNYKLWPSNYIAYDLLKNEERFTNQYSEKEKRQFDRRISRRVDVKNPLALNSYLLMYANPVINKLSLNEE